MIQRILPLLYFFLLIPSTIWALSPCDTQYRADIRSTLKDDAIDESSGLVASLREKGLFWTHNDSGDRGRIFGIDAGGETRAIATLFQNGKDFEPYDAEDIAIGPCSQKGGRCLFLADVGDNDEERPAVFVYHFAEPSIGKTKIVDFTTTEIRYPDGAHNVEALIVDPNSMSAKGPMGYLIEKTKGDARVWRVRLDGGKNKAKQVAIIKARDSGFLGGLITGADVSPDGSVLAIRTYESITLLCSKKSGRSSDKEFVNMFTSSKIKSIIPPDSMQAESIAFGFGGSLWYTSENTPAPLVSLRPYSAAKKEKGCQCSSLGNEKGVPFLLLVILGLVAFRKRKLFRN